jgi:hypothetical protein
LPTEIDELLEFANGTSALNDTMREGLVFNAFNDIGGRIHFKVISNNYLLKNE